VTHPELAKEANGWDPSAVSSGSKIKLRWKCANAHIFESSPEKRASRHQGCSYCANKKVLVGFNDFQSHYPEIANEADGWLPSEVVVGAEKSLAHR
jgi:hypothetical protein